MGNRIMFIFLLLATGMIIGMGIMVFNLGGSWHYKIESMKKSISTMSRPRIITKTISKEHSHQWFTGKMVTK